MENDPHEVSKVQCDLCNYQWIAVRPEGLTKLECPNCSNMVQFENVAINNEGREFTGVLTRDEKQICVGDKVETVQGTVFDVIKLEHATGIKYALHDGNRPYDLEAYMSPNLWLVS